MNSKQQWRAIRGIVAAASIGFVAPAWGDDDGIQVNLRDAEIRDVIDLVSEETGRNFIIDPEVEGEVNVISRTRLSERQLVELFHDVLAVHGFAAVEGESTTRIVPENQVQAEAIAGLEETGADGEHVHHIIELEYVPVSDVLATLRPMLPSEGELRGSQTSNTLVAVGSAKNVRKIERLIQRIDQPLDTDTDVIAIEHARAVSLAEQLNRTLETRPMPEGREASVVPDRNSNALIISGAKRDRLHLRSLAAKLDVEEEQGNARTHYLQYSDAEGVATLLQEILEGRGQKAEGLSEEEVRIRAHSETNTVVTYGPSDRLDELDSLVEDLDIRRAQVHVEAVIAEVSSDKARQFGVQWGIGGESAAGLLNFTGAQSGGLANLAAGVDAFLGGEVAQPPGFGDGLTFGGAGSSGSTHMAALIEALEADRSSNILSTPSLLTLDNEEAEIVVGQNVPFVMGRTIEESGQAFDTIEREDIGVQLRVRPQINQGDAVRLDVSQEVSQLAPGIQGAADLVTNTRTLDTHVLVDDGSMLVLGGLIEEQQTDSEDQVPGLGNLPGVGGLFRHQSTETEKRNLMVFIYPRIVRDGATGEALSSEKYSYIRGEQMRQQAATGRDIPVMDEQDGLTELPPSFDQVREKRDD